MVYILISNKEHNLEVNHGTSHRSMDLWEGSGI